MLKFLALLAGFSLIVWSYAVSAGETTQKKPFSCANCHATEQRNQELQGPNLAGQNSAYLIKQIRSFRSQTRFHPILNINTESPSNDEIASLATYYSNLAPENTESAVLADKLNEDDALAYSPCSACHGGDGEGISPFPRLVGQKPAYLEQQLVNFKTGVRENAVMQAIAINLSDKEIKSLAAYLGSKKQAKKMMTSNIIAQ